MWEFYQLENTLVWVVTNDEQFFNLHYREEAIALNALLNEHEIKLDGVIDYTKLSRLTIVNHNKAIPRVLEEWGVNIKPSVQDEGRTLKLFLTSIK